MDKMNVLNVLTVSLPEAILSVFIGFLVIGEKHKLFFNKLNLIKLGITLVLMLSGSVIIRNLMPNIGAILFSHIALYTGAIKFVYNTDYNSKLKNVLLNNWQKPLIMSVFMLGFLVFAEMLFVSQLSLFLDKHITDFYSENLKRILYSLPSRILQLSAVITLWNWNITLCNMRRFKDIRNIAVITILFLLIGECSFLYIITSHFVEYGFKTRIFLTLSFGSLMGLNFCIFRLITVVTKVVKLEDLRNFKILQKERDKIIEIAYNYLEKNDIKKAKKMLKQ